MNWVLESLECWKVEFEGREPKIQLSKMKTRHDQTEMISVLPLHPFRCHLCKGVHLN